MSILTGQDKLNQALHNDSCDGKWTLRVNDPCNATKLDDLIEAIQNLNLSGSSGLISGNMEGGWPFTLYLTNQRADGGAP